MNIISAKAGRGWVKCERLFVRDQRIGSLLHYSRSILMRPHFLPSQTSTKLVRVKT